MGEKRFTVWGWVEVNQPSAYPTRKRQRSDQARPEDNRTPEPEKK